MDKNESYTASEKKIIDVYEVFGSIKKTSSEPGYSWNKVVKLFLVVDIFYQKLMPRFWINIKME